MTKDSLHECNFIEEQEPDGRLILGPCIECGIPAAEAMKEFSTTKELLRETQDNRNKAWNTVTALQQKLLASEVRGGELREALEVVHERATQISEFRKGKDVVCNHIPIFCRCYFHRLAQDTHEALSKPPSHYSSQVEAIGKMVEALESGQEIVFEGCPHIALNKDLVAEALTTWNSIKGEREA